MKMKTLDTIKSILTGPSNHNLRAAEGSRAESVYKSIQQYSWPITRDDHAALRHQY